MRRVLEKVRWTVFPSNARQLHEPADALLHEVVQLLLRAGADRNDGESLYHALEVPDTTILSLLLQAGARVEGTNALYHALDFDNLEALQMLLDNAPSRDEPQMGPLLLWALRRRRSVAHIEALLAAGIDPNARTKEGTSAPLMALRYGLPESATVLRRAGVQ